jgi:hypothetical protein
MKMDVDIERRAVIGGRAPRIAGVGLLTGWGEGVGALPPPGAAIDADVVTVPTPVLAGERFRRATRECLLGVAVVRAALADAGLAADAVAGERTGLLYASATAYTAANRAFLEDEAATTLHFPYTAPSALPGEVTIEFAIRGPYVHVMGGGPATLECLWYAARWLDEGRADRVLVLVVEAVQEVRDLWARARRLVGRPLLESAACLVLEPGRGAPLVWAGGAGEGAGGGAGPAVAAVLDDAHAATPPGALVVAGPGPGPATRQGARVLAARGLAARRADGPGEALAAGPLIGLARARAAHPGAGVLLQAAWRDEQAVMWWPEAAWTSERSRAS